jgi:hypothetical protein
MSFMVLAMLLIVALFILGITATIWFLRLYDRLFPEKKDSARVDEQEGPRG